MFPSAWQRSDDFSVHEIKEKTMVKLLASKIWRFENAFRFTCPICDYNTHNKTLFRRHQDSTRHFLLTEFAYQAPREIKMLVATFLPFDRIYLLGKIAVDALNFKRPKWASWFFTGVDPANLLSQTASVRVRLKHTKRNQASVLPLE